MRLNPLLAEQLFGQEEIEEVADYIHRIDYDRNLEVLYDAHRAWESLDEFRRQASRYENYVFGDQWGDRIPDPECCNGTITERDNIKRQGRVPLTNNRIRGIVRSVLGLFASNRTEPICTARKRDAQKKGEVMSMLLQYIYQNNEAWKLDRRNLEYFLVSGMAVYRTSFSNRRGDVNVWADIINYNDFFFDTHTKDPRMWDCNLVGQIHDISWNELLARFASTEEDRLKLKEIYTGVNKDRVISEVSNFLMSERGRKQISLSFFMPEDNTQCRVIEVWKKVCEQRLFIHDSLSGQYYSKKIDNKILQQIAIENQRRVKEQSEMGVTRYKLIKYKKKFTNYWRCYFLSPYGDVLISRETPYRHKEHPYSFSVYPYYNKNAYPFVGDFIDQQRYINRIITLQDFIMGTSAKGVLMFPEEAKPDNMSMDEIADQWVRADGVILYKGNKSSTPPQQIVSQQRLVGATEMLQIQLKLLEDISGVQGALQGQAPKSGTPAALFEQQIQNSANTLTDMFEEFKILRESRDKKIMSLAQQFITEPKLINVTGSTFTDPITEYIPEEMADVDFDLVISESTNTPAYRMVINDLLLQLWQSGAINVKQLLKVGSFPFSDQLLQSIEAEEEKVQQQMQTNQTMMDNGQVGQGQPIGQVFNPYQQQQGQGQQGQDQQQMMQEMMRQQAMQQQQ